MVVVSGRSSRHVMAISDHLLSDLKDEGLGSARVEGQEGGDWILIDTGDVIVHVFRPEIREFYNIEKMWAAPDMDEETVHYQAAGRCVRGLIDGIYWPDESGWRQVCAAGCRTAGADDACWSFCGGAAE